MQSSFKAVKLWIRELKQYAEADIVLAIAGNKCDLDDLREIQYKGLEFQSSGFLCSCWYKQGFSLLAISVAKRVERLSMTGELSLACTMMCS